MAVASKGYALWKVYWCSCERLACTVLKAVEAHFHYINITQLRCCFPGQDASVRRRNRHQYRCVRRSPRNSGDVPKVLRKLSKFWSGKKKRRYWHVEFLMKANLWLMLGSSFVHQHCPRNFKAEGNQRLSLDTNWQENGLMWIPEWWKSYEMASRSKLLKSHGKEWCKSCGTNLH